MSTLLDAAWPGAPAYVVMKMDAGVVRRVAEGGDLDQVRPWASLSKMAVALAVGVEVDWGLHHYEETVGPRGATLANLLSHSSGLGLEEGDPEVAVATKRVYSNYGIDRAVAAVVGEGSPADWLDDRVWSPLGMGTTRLEGRAASGVEGSTNDLARLALAWLRSDALTDATRARIVTPYRGDLEGVVPGFGRFRPCPWGLGPEVRGAKNHWMGDWPPESFGHFSQSGALMLVDLSDGVAVAATSSEPFGPWAVALWPQWTSRVRALATAQ